MTLIAKPAQPVEARGLPGCLFFMPLSEGSGGPLDWSGSDYNGTIVGSALAWGSSSIGPYLSGFSTSNYVKVDPPAPIAVTPPWWFAAVVSRTATASAAAISQGNSTSNTVNFIELFGTTSAGTVTYKAIDAAGTTMSCQATGTAINDGSPHVVMGVTYAANRHVIYFDGLQINQNTTTTLGTITCNQLTVGALRNNTISQAFNGQIYLAACGAGTVPDPWRFATDPWAAVRRVHAKTMARWAATSAAIIPSTPPSYIPLNFANLPTPLPA